MYLNSRKSAYGTFVNCYCVYLQYYNCFSFSFILINHVHICSFKQNMIDRYTRNKCKKTLEWNAQKVVTFRKYYNIFKQVLSSMTVKVGVASPKKLREAQNDTSS